MASTRTTLVRFALPRWFSAACWHRSGSTKTICRRNFQSLISKYSILGCAWRLRRCVYIAAWCRRVANARMRSRRLLAVVRHSDNGPNALVNEWKLNSWNAIHCKTTYFTYCKFIFHVWFHVQNIVSHYAYRVPSAWLRCPKHGVSRLVLHI